MKRCSKCKLEQEDNQFYTNPKMRTGLHSWCKGCYKISAAAYAKTEKGKLVARRTTLRKFGLDELEYSIKLELQGGKCGICGAEPSGRSLDVDHCHITGSLRGLLCHNCNVGLGHFKDDIKLLQKAIEWIYQEH